MISFEGWSIHAYISLGRIIGGYFCYLYKKYYLMASLKSNYNSYQERIQLGSISIPNASLPFSTFLIGYFSGKHGVTLDLMFEVVDLLEELLSERMISQIIKKQVLSLMEDFPRDIRNIAAVLADFKNGKNVDLIRWIEGYYQNGGEESREGGGRGGERRETVISEKHPSQKAEEVQMKHNDPVPLNNVVIDGTLQLQVSSHTEQLEQQLRRQEQDGEMARKMQQQFDRQQKNEQKQDDDIPCQICYCNLYDNPFDLLDGCGHFFHTNCMGESFKTNIMDNNFPIVCPKEQCKKELSQQDLKRILQPKMFEKYQSHTLKAYADGHGDSISWCPTANCSYMFFFEIGDPERFECLQCKKEYCLNCRVEWHKEMTCKQYKVNTTMSEEDQKFLEFAKGKKFKQCPKCKFWVEKNEGCDHMTCKCKFQFCYKCGGVYMKCECMEQMRKEQERRREQLEERRRRKEERKRNAAEKGKSRTRAQEEKARREEEKQREREERDKRANRSRRRK